MGTIEFSNVLLIKTIHATHKVDSGPGPRPTSSQYTFIHSCFYLAATSPAQRDGKKYPMANTWFV